MHSKLTLRLDNRLIKAAKKYSKSHEKSLSQLVADYFLLITGPIKTNHEEDVIPPITASLQGILQGKNIHENLYKQYLEEKYK